jgi:hypothetical protein
VLSGLTHGAGEPAASRTCGSVVGNVRRSNESRTSRIRTVSSLTDVRVEFFPFCFERRGQAVVDLCADVGPGHLETAASRRVQSLVCHGSAVELLQTAHAVMVVARRLPDFCDGIAVFTRCTLDSGSRSYTGFGQFGFFVFELADGFVLVQLVCVEFGDCYVVRIGISVVSLALEFCRVFELQSDDEL